MSDPASPNAPEGLRGERGTRRTIWIVLAAGLCLLAAGLMLARPWGTDPQRPSPPSAATTSGGETSTRSCDPRRIDVDALGITEPLVAEGLNSAGELNPDPKQTVWYTGSAHPGEPGIAVIAGHVQNTTPDVFWELDQIKVGDAVTVTCADGRVLPLTATRTASVDKQDLTTDETVWGESKTPSVVLITCDRNSPVVGRHHVNNFVVWTAPAT